MVARAGSRAYGKIRAQDCPAKLVSDIKSCEVHALKLVDKQRIVTYVCESGETLTIRIQAFVGDQRQKHA